MSFDRKPLEALLPSKPITQVAHYTKIETLPKFLKEPGTTWKSARATGVLYLNDRKEFTIGRDALLKAALKLNANPFIQTEIDNLVQKPSEPGQDVYSISFSGNHDELGQWRGYADNGFGCCVVTDVDAVYKSAHVAGWTVYRPLQRSKFATSVIKLLLGVNDKSVIRKSLQVAASFMKHEGFEPESEYRLLVFEENRTVDFRPSGQRLVPFVEVLDISPAPVTLPVNRVIVGPSWQLASLPSDQQNNHHVTLGIRRLLSPKSETDKVIPSAIPYDPR